MPRKTAELSVPIAATTTAKVRMMPTDDPLSIQGFIRRTNYILKGGEEKNCQNSRLQVGEDRLPAVASKQIGRLALQLLWEFLIGPNKNARRPLPQGDK